jgi:hypothetical protein
MLLTITTGLCCLIWYAVHCVRFIWHVQQSGKLRCFHLNRPVSVILVVSWESWKVLVSRSENYFISCRSWDNNEPVVSSFISGFITCTYESSKRKRCVCCVKIRLLWTQIWYTLATTCLKIGDALILLLKCVCDQFYFLIGLVRYWWRNCCFRWWEYQWLWAQPRGSRKASTPMPLPCAHHLQDCWLDTEEGHSGISPLHHFTPTTRSPYSKGVCHVWT